MRIFHRGAAYTGSSFCGLSGTTCSCGSAAIYTAVGYTLWTVGAEMQPTEFVEGTDAQ